MCIGIYTYIYFILLDTYIDTDIFLFLLWLQKEHHKCIDTLQLCAYLIRKIYHKSVELQNSISTEFKTAMLSYITN